MSGHSKWHNIQAKKGKADAQRGAIFTKIGREIAIAVREGGANPESNGKLRDIIAKAKANNMPNDNIQRSIKKASGELSNVVYEEITYEGYAPGGVAVIVDTTAATWAPPVPSDSCLTSAAYWLWNASPAATRTR